MKILFIGDSIIKGTQGVDWVRMIAKKHTTWKIENAGINGQTLNKITDRLISKVSHAKYDAIVLEVGYNDILLPTFKHKRGWFSKAYYHQLKQGYIPSAIGDFEMILREAVDYIRNVSKAKIILPTISCINENLQTDINNKVISYNKVIKKIARESDGLVADVHERFSSVLKHGKGQDYLLESFVNTTVLDPINCLIGRADALSESRGLELTIDGVHPNTKGALLFKEEVEKALMRIDEKIPLYI